MFVPLIVGPVILENAPVLHDKTDTEIVDARIEDATKSRSISVEFTIVDA